MEGGITPQGLPIIPYLRYGDKRGLFINNIDTASAAQLLHEYFHMIESVMDTGFPGHAWLKNVDGPPGISTELEYYRYIYDRLVTANSDAFLYRSKHGSSKSSDTELYDKVMRYKAKYTEEALRQAFVCYKLGDDASLERSLRYVPDYPFSSAVLGGRLRFQSQGVEAYQKLKVSAEIDPDNSLRDMYMGWLLTYNLDLAEYALPYYERILPEYDQFHSSWKYYLIDGLAKGYIAAGEYDKARALIADDKCAA